MTVKYSPIMWTKAEIEHGAHTLTIKVLNADERKARCIDWPVARIAIRDLEPHVPGGGSGLYWTEEKADMLIGIDDLIELGESLKRLPRDDK